MFLSYSLCCICCIPLVWLQVIIVIMMCILTSSIKRSTCKNAEAFRISRCDHKEAFSEYLIAVKKKDVPCVNVIPLNIYVYVL